MEATHLGLALDAFLAAQRRLVALLSLLGRLMVVGMGIVGWRWRVVGSKVAARCFHVQFHGCMSLCSIRPGVTAAWM